ncbi:MAG: hypothetical protein GYB50_20510 [Rhodobacteraceae bacterium]|nr:hypothetical protein [Paracoccaceae bacterium]
MKIWPFRPKADDCHDRIRAAAPSIAEKERHLALLKARSDALSAEIEAALTEIAGQPKEGA